MCVRIAIEHAYDDGTNILGISEEVTGLEQGLSIAEGLGPRLRLSVGLLQHRDEDGRAQIAGSQALRIEEHPDRAGLTADDRCLRDLRQHFDGILDLHRQLAELRVVITGAVEGEGQNRHVVDRSRFEQRRNNSKRHAVEIGLELLVQTDQGHLRVDADLKTDDGHVGTGASRGVQVFDPGDLPEEHLHGAGDPVLDLVGRCTRHGYHDIDHRNLDLRLLLAGEEEHGKDAEQQGRCDQDGGQLRVDEKRRHPAGNAVAGRLVEGGRGSGSHG